MSDRTCSDLTFKTSVIIALVVTKYDFLRYKIASKLIVWIHLRALI